MAVRFHRIRVSPTSMERNGEHMPSSLYSRDCPMTDNELAEKAGFEGFMEMAHWLSQAYGELPFEGTLITFQEG